MFLETALNIIRQIFNKLRVGFRGSFRRVYCLAAICGRNIGESGSGADRMNVNGLSNCTTGGMRGLIIATILDSNLSKMRLLLEY